VHGRAWACMRRERGGNARVMGCFMNVGRCEEQIKYMLYLRQQKQGISAPRLILRTASPHPGSSSPPPCAQAASKDTSPLLPTLNLNIKPSF